MKKAVLMLLFLISSLAYAADVKEADLAGSWYPASKGALEALLTGYIDAAHPEKVEGRIFAIIAPHAGYQYSGPVAAYGYKAAGGQTVKTVILIGFSHRLPFDGISIYDKGSFRTPLGDIAIDEVLAGRILRSSNRMSFYPAAFSGENSVEMQVPFIQVAFKGASIVPIAFGTQSYSDAVVLADALAAALKGRGDCIILASTDLSHYHPYEDANRIDAHMIDVLKKMNARDLYDETVIGRCEMCGLMPVTTTLLTAEKLGFDKVKIFKYANSGDTAGDKSKVVGYLSAVIYSTRTTNPETRLSAEARRAKAETTTKEDFSMLLNNSQKKRLLEIARQSMTGYVKDGRRMAFKENDAVLNETMGAFVTIHEAGQLRGCIGNMVGQGPLYQTVADMAIEAATADPRFRPLSPDELDKIDIEVSALSPMKKVANPDEIKIPGHGVVVKRGFRSGVYLPQVATETGWGKEEFMTSLCAHKAGLSPDAWKDPATEIYVFTAEVFGEKEGGR